MAKRNHKADELDTNMPASHLLKIIAGRARRTNEFNVLNLKIGEAFLGDYRSYGMTQQQYRTAKKQLTKWGFATFRATSKGTVATLLDDSIYDINPVTSNKPATNKQQKGNEQLTTNNNDNNGNNDNNVNKRKKKHFVPPTLQEVKDYILEKKYTVDAERFFEYFTESGWVDSKGNSVRNWKQKIITWSSYGSNGETATSPRTIDLDKQAIYEANLREKGCIVLE